MLWAAPSSRGSNPTFLWVYSKFWPLSGFFFFCWGETDFYHPAPPFVLPGNQPTVLESAEAFHPEKNKWESLPPMPTPRCACSSIALRDCLLAVGGVSQGLSTAVEALCLSDS